MADRERCVVLIEPTLVLVFIALIPRRLLTLSLRMARRGRTLIWAVALTVFVIALVFSPLRARAVGMLVFPVALLVEFLTQYGRSDRPIWFRVGLLATLAALPGVRALSAFRLVPTLEAPGRAHFWILDLFDKTFFAVLHPLLKWIGLGEATDFVVALLLEGHVFVSEHILAIHMAVNFLALALLFEIARARVPSLGTPPRLCSVSIPVWLAIVPLLGLWMSAQYPQSVLIRGLTDLPLGLYVLRGVTLLFVVTAGSARLRSLFWAGLVVAVLVPRLFWLGAAAAFVDGLLGASEHLAARGGELQLVRQQLATIVALLQRRMFVYAVPGYLVVALCIFAVAHYYDDESPIRDDGQLLDPVAGGEPPAAADTISVAAAGSSFFIDRYEYPNRRGTLPTTGLSPTSAQAACRELGKELCTSRQWYLACSEGGRNRFLWPGMGPLQSVNRLRATCNVRHKDRSPRLQTSGSFEDCRNSLGVSDLVGNALEWVETDIAPGVWGLKGSYYGYGDQQNLECRYLMLLHESQIGAVDRDGIGFRCCGSTDPPR